MASQPPLIHKRTDSGVDGVEPARAALTTAQHFCKGVALFASEHGFKIMNDLVESAPQRELEIKNRDKTIQDLRDELIAVRKDRDVFNKQQISDFERRYEDWSEDNTALKEEINDLEATLEEKDTKVTELQNHLNDLTARVDDLEKENGQLTTKVKERGQQLGTLEARLQRAQADMDGRTKEVEEARKRMSALQGKFDNEENQHRVLREEANKIRARLKDLVQFSVKITELDLADVTIRMEKLWTTATAMVENFFGRNMPENILKNDWTGLRDNDIFKHQIPLPQSNTDVARRMRAAVILGALTRLIDNFVFQPTYLLDERSGLREVLLNEAAMNPAKERYTRGILLSMSPEEQEAYSEGIVHVVTQQLLDIVNVRALLTPETFATFPEALGTFIRQCQEEWKIVQRGRQKLEPEFAYLASTRYPWQLYGKNNSGANGEKQSEDHSATTAIENNVVLIPRIYHMVSKADPDPITHGCILCKAHLHAAAAELRNSGSGAPFTQTSSSRHRSRPTRTMSISGRGKPFLVQ